MKNKESRLNRVFEFLSNNMSFKLAIASVRSNYSITPSEFKTENDAYDFSLRLQEGGRESEFNKDINNLINLSVGLLKKMDKLDIEIPRVELYIQNFLFQGEENAKLTGIYGVIGAQIFDADKLVPEDLKQFQQRYPNSVFIAISPGSTKTEVVNLITESFPFLESFKFKYKPRRVRKQTKDGLHQLVKRRWDQYRNNTIAELRKQTGHTCFNKYEAVSEILLKDFGVKVTESNVRKIADMAKISKK